METSVLSAQSCCEPNNALKNKVRQKKKKKEGVREKNMLFFLTNCLFLGIIVYIFMEWMLSPLTCSIEYT